MTNFDAQGSASDPAEAPVRPTVSVSDGVLRIVVSTAAAGTSLDIDAITAGAAALADVNAGNATIGAVLLVGDGPNFCAGGNVRAFAAAPDRGAYVKDVADAFHAFVRELAATRVPIVAGVHGWAAGAGMSIVCHCDIAIGGRSTKLRPAYPGIGFTPDGGLTWTLPRLVGTARAREILLGDTVLNGEEAVRLGLIGRLVGDDLIGSEAERLARTLAAGPTSAYTGTKALLETSERTTLAEQLDAEALSISRAADGPSGREGVDAFTQKRRPDFS